MGSDYTGKPLLSSIFTMLGGAPQGAAGAAQVDVLGETGAVQMDVYETKEELVVEIDMPGVSVTDISVRIQGGWLIVEALKKEEPREKNRINFLCMERVFGPARRLLKLTAAVDSESVKGLYKNGMLVIRMPKREERRNRARHISIEETEG